MPSSALLSGHRLPHHRCPFLGQSGGSAFVVRRGEVPLLLVDVDVFLHFMLLKVATPLHLGHYMKPDLPGLPTMSSLLLAAIMTAWLGIWGPISLEGIAKWQTLIGALITAAGVFVAAYNVTRQMRAAARTREEDRLERDIPGLQSACVLIANITPMLSPPFSHNDGPRAVEYAGIGDNGRGLLKELERLIPAAPDQVRRDLSGLLSAVCHYAERKEYCLDFLRRVGLGDADRELLPKVEQLLQECEEKYPEACDNLKSYNDQLARRIMRARVRLLHLRREHERQLEVP